MSRPREYDDRIGTALRIDRDLHERIAAEADARGVSANWLIVRLVAEGLDRLIPVDELRMTRGES